MCRLIRLTFLALSEQTSRGILELNLRLLAYSEVNSVGVLVLGKTERGFWMLLMVVAGRNSFRTLTRGLMLGIPTILADATVLLRGRKTIVLLNIIELARL